MIANLTNPGKRPEGASTITQQVAKNFLLTNEATLARKIREAILAFRIEETFTKERILELYLNEIYLGSGNYGVAAAALNYFDKSLDELTCREIAYLAALPKAPNRYNIAAQRRRKRTAGATTCSAACSRTATSPPAEAAGRRAEKLAAAPPRRPPRRRRPTSSPRKCAATCGAPMARRASTKAA